MLALIFGGDKSGGWERGDFSRVHGDTTLRAMDWRAYAVQMAAYNRWMNGKVYETCQSVADSDRKKDLGAFFGSIHHTLDHILWADDALLIRLREEDRNIEPYRAPMIADFEELLQQNPENIAVQQALATTYASTKKYDKALEHLSKAIELAPENALNYAMRAEVYEVQEKFEEALADLTQALKLQPNSAAALLVDGEIVAAAQEERFTRKKHDARFPEHAVSYCLGEAGIRVKDLDSIVFYDKPLVKFERILTTYIATFPRSLPSFTKSLPIWLKLPREWGLNLQATN